MADVVEWRPTDNSAARNYHFLVSSVMPRPIAWITTRNPDGSINAAPFSWFNAICADPPLLAVSIARHKDRRKDTAQNILREKEFVVNLVTRERLEQAVATSKEFAPGVSEIAELGVAVSPVDELVRIDCSPVAFVCKLHSHQVLGNTQLVDFIIGEVTKIVADPGVLDERGNLDATKVTLAARMGGNTYTDTNNNFQVERPE